MQSRILQQATATVLQLNDYNDIVGGDHVRGVHFKCKPGPFFVFIPRRIRWAMNGRVEGLARLECLMV